jgi:hypothetical protein
VGQALRREKGEFILSFANMSADKEQNGRGNRGASVDSEQPETVQPMHSETTDNLLYCNRPIWLSIMTISSPMFMPKFHFQSCPESLFVSPFYLLTLIEAYDCLRVELTYISITHSLGPCLPLPLANAWFLPISFLSPYSVPRCSSFNDTVSTLESS